MKKKSLMILKLKLKFFSDPAFTAEFNKQQQDLKRKKGELEKISQVITKKAELLKTENQEKQQ